MNTIVDWSAGNVGPRVCHYQNNEKDIQIFLFRVRIKAVQL